MLPEAFYDNKPRVLLVDDSAARVKAPPAGTAHHQGAAAAPAGVAAATGARKTPKVGGEWVVVHI